MIGIILMHQIIDEGRIYYMNMKATKIEPILEFAS